MGALAAIGRALAGRNGAPKPFVHRHGEAERQARQRAAARAAFLSDLPPGQRALAARTFGDIH